MVALEHFFEALQRRNGTPMCVLNRSEKVSTAIISCLKERLIIHAVVFAFFPLMPECLSHFYDFRNYQKTQFDCLRVCVRAAISYLCVYSVSVLHSFKVLSNFV